MEKSTIAALEAVSEVLGDFLGQDASELVTALTIVTETDDGKTTTAKPASEIKSYLQPLIAEKRKSIGQTSNKESRDRGRREAFEEVEKAAKAKGVEMSWKEDKFDKLIDHFSKANEMSDDDVEKSQFVKDLKRTHKEMIAELKKTHSKDMAEVKSKRVEDYAIKELNSLITGKDSKRQVYTDKANQKLFRQILNTIKNTDGVYLGLDDNNKVVLLNEDGEPYEDESYNQISFKKMALAEADDFFPKNASDSRRSRGPKEDEEEEDDIKGDVFEYTDSEGKQKKFNLPSFKTPEEFSQVLSDLPEDVDIEVVEKLDEVSKEIFSET